MRVKKKVKSSFLAKHIAELSTWSFILITIILYSGFYPGQTWARNYSSDTSTYIYDFKPAKSREHQLLDIGKQEFYNYNQGLGRMEHELQVSVLAPTVFLPYPLLLITIVAPVVARAIFMARSPKTFFLPRR